MICSYDVFVLCEAHASVKKASVYDEKVEWNILEFEFIVLPSYPIDTIMVRIHLALPNFISAITLNK